MDAFHFFDVPALFCGTCARKQLRGDNLTATEKKETLEGARVLDGGGEADCPQHCDTCGEFLENPLTRDGAEYVAEAIERAVRERREKSVALTIWKPFYKLEVRA